MICYAVVDTNVLVSALLSNKDDAATVLIVKKLFGGEIIPVFSNDVIREYREVLNRKKFGFSPDTVDYLISAVKQFGILLDDAYLVTGNKKHFPVKTFVVTPRELLDLLERSE